MFATFPKRQKLLGLTLYITRAIKKNQLYALKQNKHDIHWCLVFAQISDEIDW